MKTKAAAPAGRRTAYGKRQRNKERTGHQGTGATPVVVVVVVVRGAGRDSEALDSAPSHLSAIRSFFCRRSRAATVSFTTADSFARASRSSASFLAELSISPGM